MGRMRLMWGAILTLFCVAAFAAPRVIISPLGDGVQFLRKTGSTTSEVVASYDGTTGAPFAFDLGLSVPDGGFMAYGPLDASDYIANGIAIGGTVGTGPFVVGVGPDATTKGTVNIYGLESDAGGLTEYAEFASGGATIRTTLNVDQGVTTNTNVYYDDNTAGFGTLRFYQGAGQQAYIISYSDSYSTAARQNELLIGTQNIAADNADILFAPEEAEVLRLASSAITASVPVTVTHSGTGALTITRTGTGADTKYIDVDSAYGLKIGTSLGGSEIATFGGAVIALNKPVTAKSAGVPLIVEGTGTAASLEFKTSAGTKGYLEAQATKMVMYASATPVMDFATTAITASVPTFTRTSSSGNSYLRSINTSTATSSTSNAIDVYNNDSKYAAIRVYGSNDTDGNLGGVDRATTSYVLSNQNMLVGPITNSTLYLGTNNTNQMSVTSTAVTASVPISIGQADDPDWLRVHLDSLNTSFPSYFYVQSGTYTAQRSITQLKSLGVISGGGYSGAFEFIVSENASEKLIATMQSNAIFTEVPLTVDVGSGTNYTFSTAMAGKIQLANGDSTNEVPTIAGISNNTGTGTGVLILAGANDGNTSGDMWFNISTPAGGGFTTTTRTGFKFTHSGNSILEGTRAGNWTIGPASFSFLQHQINANTVSIDATGNTGSDVQVALQMEPKGTARSLYLSVAGSDTGTSSVITMDGRLAAAAIATRPLFSLENYGQWKLQVAASGTMYNRTTSGAAMITKGADTAGINSIQIWQDSADFNVGSIDTNGNVVLRGNSITIDSVSGSAALLLDAGSGQGNIDFYNAGGQLWDLGTVGGSPFQDFYLYNRNLSNTNWSVRYSDGKITHGYYTELGQADAVDGGGTTPAFAVLKLTGTTSLSLNSLDLTHTLGSYARIKSAFCELENDAVIRGFMVPGNYSNNNYTATVEAVTTNTLRLNNFTRSTGVATNWPFAFAVTCYVFYEAS